MLVDVIQYHVDTKMKDEKIETLDKLLLNIQEEMKGIEDDDPTYKHLSRKSKRFNDLKLMMLKKEKEISNSYKLNYALCFKEEIVSSLYYDTVILEYLKKCGYEIKKYGEETDESNDEEGGEKEVEQEVTEKQKKKDCDKKFVKFPYLKIPELFFYEQVMEILSRPTRSAKQKAQVERYLFDEFINFKLSEEVREKIFHKYWFPIRKANIFHYIQIENSKEVEIMEMNAKESKYNYRHDPNDVIKVRLCMLYALGSGISSMNSICFISLTPLTFSMVRKDYRKKIFAPS